MANSLMRGARKIHDGLIALPVTGLLLVALEQAAYDILAFWVLRRNFGSVYSKNCDVGKVGDSEILDLVSVAFNNEIVVEAQIRLLKKYLSDLYRLTIIDNSSDISKRKLIEQACERGQAGYISFPHNPFSGRFGNWSHGLVLNWAFRQYFQPRAARYFGFLDHDIFPIRKTGVIEYLRAYPLAGALHENKEVWYLWPGLCFFRSELFQHRSPNFSSGFVRRGLKAAGLDTGGRNWKILYAHIPKTDCYAFIHKVAFYNDRYPQGEMFEMLGLTSEVAKRHDTGVLGASDKLVEFLGDWLHIRRMGYGGVGELASKREVIVNHYLNTLQ